MTVCFFGTYIRTYSRNKVIIDGMRGCGHTVMEINVPNPQSKLDNKRHLKFMALLGRIFHKFRLLPLFLTNIGQMKKADIIIVLFPGHLDIPLAYLAAKFLHKKLVFDPTVSLYSMLVEDFLLISPQSFLARVVLFCEKILFSLPDAIIADTPLQKEYYRSQFHVPDQKLSTLPIGADASIYQHSPFRKNPQPFVVLYYGLYNPMHGVSYIIQAANCLKSHTDIVFRMIGNGQTYFENVALAEKLKLQNVQFYKDMRESDALTTLQTADVFLGFMQNAKAIHRQLPNKVFQGMALGKAVVTADTPAIRSVFKHKRDIFLIPPNDYQTLTDAIITLKEDTDLRQRIAANGYARYSHEFTSEEIGRQFSGILKRIYSRKPVQVQSSHTMFKTLDL